MSERQENGVLTLRTFLIILGLMITISSMSLGYVVTRVNSADDQLETLKSIQAINRERLASLEQNSKDIDRRLGNIEKVLGDILNIIR